MTFREAYKADFDMINPENALIDNILNKVQSGYKTSARIPLTRVTMAAAGICILIASAVIIPAILRSGDRIILNNKSTDNSGIASIFGLYDDNIIIEKGLYDEDVIEPATESADAIPFFARGAEGYVEPAPFFAQEAENHIENDEEYDTGGTTESGTPADDYTIPESIEENSVNEIIIYDILESDYIAVEIGEEMIPQPFYTLPSAINAVSAEDITLIWYGGTYNGCEVAIFYEYDNYTSDMKIIDVAGYSFYLESGSLNITLHKDTSFIELSAAYAEGYLSDEDIALIYHYYTTDENPEPLSIEMELKLKEVYANYVNLR